MAGNEKSRPVAATTGRDGGAGTFGGVHASCGHCTTSAQPRQGSSGDFFRTIREAVTAEEAAVRYGVEVDRHHKALCPFHSEKTASLSFHGGRYRCFGCGAAGDAVDFTARLYGIRPLEAAQKINADFGLGLSVGGKPTAEEREAIRRREALRAKCEAFKAWREETRLTLAEIHRIGWTSLKSFRVAAWPTPEALEQGQLDAGRFFDGLTPREARCINALDTVDYYSEVLTGGALEEQAELYRRKEMMSAWMHRILSD